MEVLFNTEFIGLESLILNSESQKTLKLGTWIRSNPLFPQISKPSVLFLDRHQCTRNMLANLTWTSWLDFHKFLIALACISGGMFITNYIIFHFRLWYPLPNFPIFFRVVQLFCRQLPVLALLSYFARFFRHLEAIPWVSMKPFHSCVELLVKQKSLTRQVCTSDNASDIRGGTQK
jgi:hypothetical protein